MAKILVVAAHPDDETLGCGGTIARHSFAGDEVHVVFMTDGVSARGSEDTQQAVKREHSKDCALAVLGVRASRSLGFPDNKIDAVPLLDVVQSLESAIASIAPEVIYTHHHGDLNVDHRIAFQAVMTACRPQPGCSVRKILCFEVVSSTEWAGGMLPFEPNVFVDIGPFWGKKLEALKAYEQELRAWPHARSLVHLDALSLHRGSCVGLQRAEAFRLVRDIS